MSLKILCAGYNKDEKFDLEKRVRSMFGRPMSEQSWTISLVKLGGQVQVTVDGPDERLRNQCFMSEPRLLQEALGDLLKNNGFDLSAPAAEPAPAPRPTITPSAPRPAPSAYQPAPTPIPKPAPVAPQPAPVAAKPAPRPAPAAHGGGSATATANPAAEPARSWIPAPPRVAAPTPAPPRPAPPPPSRPPAPAAPPPRAARSAPSAPVPRAKSPAARGGVSAPPASTHQTRDTHTCPSCSGAFVVTYEVHPGEPHQLVAVACPHCWKLDHVEVAEGAAIERAYRADKA